MIDTQVLSYALVTEPPTDDKMRGMQRDCGALINGMAEVRVSALVVLELLRTPPQIVAKVRASGILELLQVEALDYEIAKEAARILEVARSREDMCTRCFNIRRATECPACKQLVSHQQKTHDVLILATAVMLADVEVLYTYDPGILTLATFVKNLRVESPPNLDGPLFAKHPP